MTEPNRGPAWLVLPTYNEAENIEPFVAAVRANLPADARILIVDDGSPDGTGERPDRPAPTHPDRRRPAPAREGRARARLHRRVPAGARRRGGAGAGDGLRLLPRPGLPAAAARRGPERRPGDRLALRRRRRGQRLGRRAAGDQPWRQRLLAARPRGRGPRPHRRLQVLPARGAGGDRPRPGRGARLRLPGRDDLPDDPARLQGGRGADRLPRPPRRRLEDGRRDRRRGGPPVAPSALRLPPRAAGRATARGADGRRGVAAAGGRASDPGVPGTDYAWSPFKRALYFLK